MTTEPATVQGRYRLGPVLGAGGMGCVWLARDETLDRDVAIKEILPPDQMLEADREALRRLMLREGRASARLSHPNVARVYDAFESAGRAWIVMEHVPSRSLQQVLDQDGALPPERVAWIGLELLSALIAAHAAGVRHRDVKPANVLLGDDGRVVLTDFGVAAVDGESIVTSSGLVVGSPQYMAPERLRDGAARAAGDLWSLGATLYAAVEGHPPYQRSSVMETITAIAADEPAPPRQAGPLRPALEGLLRKDPDRRIDAAEAERRLRAALDEAEAAADVMAPPPAAEASPALALDAADPDPRAPDPDPRAPDPAGPVPDNPAPDNPADEVTVPDATGLDPTAPDVSAPDQPTRGIATAGRDSATEGRDGAADGRDGAADGRDGAADGRDFPEQPGGRRRRGLIAVAAAVAVALAGGLVWAVLRPDDHRTGGGAQAPRPGTTATATPSAAPSAMPSSAPPAVPSAAAPNSVRPPSSPTAASTVRSLPPLPAGWTDYRDPTGFALYVPRGWTRSKEDGIVYFRSRGRSLGIDQTDSPRPDPVADWRGKARYRVNRGDFPGYRQIHIRETDYFRKAADWEFTFDGSGVRQHVNNRGFITSRHQAYGLWWQTSDAAWSGARDDLELIFRSFRPSTETG